jgi:hypothetical protein
MENQLLWSCHNIEIPWYIFCVAADQIGEVINFNPFDRFRLDYPGFLLSYYIFTSSSK